MTLGRRKLLQLLAAAAALPLLERALPAAAQGTSDTDLLVKLLETEQQASLVYGTLPGSARVPARLFREQSREHARGLAIALRDRGSRPPAPAARVGRATPKEALLLEDRAVAAYGRVIGEFRDERLLPTLAAAMANHGQHQVVLRQALGRDPLPDPFAGQDAR